jgi:WD40 repeat protein
MLNPKATIIYLGALLTALGVLTACAVEPSRPPPIYYGGSLYSTAIGAAAMSSDGKRAAVANREIIWLLDPHNLSTLRVFSSYERCGFEYNKVPRGPGYSSSNLFPRYGVDNSLLFLGNEKIATTGMFGDITIWNINQDCPEAVLSVPELEAFPISLAWSEATGRIAVGAENGRIVLLHPLAVGGYSHQTVDTLDGPVYDLIFSKDGSYLAAAGAHSEVKIWFTSSLATAGSLPVEGLVRNLHLASEERKLLVTADELELWTFLSDEQASKLENPKMGGQKAALVGLSVLAIALTVGAAAAGASPSLPIGAGGVGPTVECDRVAIISPDARLLVDRHPGILKETIRVIDLENNETIETLNPRGGQNCDMVFSPDGTKLLVAGDKKITLYDTTSWSHKNIKLKNPIY